MKVQTALLSLTIAATAGALPAAAADWGQESYKDMGVPAAVPVPAPIPTADYRPSWYFRLDFGLGVVSDPDLSGDIAELVGAPGGINGPDALSQPSTWFDSDFNTFLTGGGGVGYYFGNGWRLDATVEQRSKDDVNVESAANDPAVWTETYGYDNFGNYGVIDLDANGIADTGSRLYWSESSKIEGTIWMANLYYDFRTHSGFTPYIGAGLGFVWNEISRNISGSYGTCSNEGGAPTGCDNGSYTSTSFSASDKGETVSLAAAAMVGLSYDVTDITSIDVGYRYLFLQGASNSTSVDINGSPTESTLEIGDQHIHQVRAGLRFNVN